MENLISKSKMFYYFDKISKIPHCSFKEDKISDYLMDFAKERNLEAYQDEKYNVIIKKPASKGKEDIAPVILQGHIDMVCVKEDDIEFNFNKEHIKLKIENDWLKADGTTLGADNGIAVAMMLAILDDDEIKTPRIEALFTTMEEVGLLGAAAVKGEKLQGKTLINIDSEEEGVFTISCAGGVRQFLEFKFEREKLISKIPSYEIKISNLLGGHSGLEIDKQRANAIKLVSRVLQQFSGELRINDIRGGEAMNSIPKFAKLTIQTNEDVKSKIEFISKELNKEFEGIEEEIIIEYSNCDIERESFTSKDSNKIRNLLNVFSTGVVRMHPFIENLVETSSNLGVISILNDVITVEYCHRSSLDSTKEELIEKYKSLAELLAGTSKTQGNYPGWEYAKDSKIRELFLETYEEIYKKPAEMVALHAGLECGVLQERIGNLDMISFGPDLVDVHTPMEKLSIPSASRSFELLKRTLEKIK